MQSLFQIRDAWFYRFQVRCSKRGLQDYLLLKNLSPGGGWMRAAGGDQPVPIGTDRSCSVATYDTQYIHITYDDGL